MFDLTDERALSKADPGGMLADVLGSGAQLESARQSALSAGISFESPVSQIAYLGMGGSGIAGDVLAALAVEHSRIPVSVSKGYQLPAWVSGAETVVIACSYSGNTEETLSAVKQAKERGCQVVSITSGGQLGELSGANGFQVISVPDGIQPRAAFPSLVAATLSVGEAIGALPDLTEDFEKSARAIGQAVEASSPDEGGGFAMELAQRLDGKHVHAWGTDGVSAVAAARLKCQIQENAKAPASFAVLPELDHNEVVGYDPGLETLQKTCLVILRHEFEHPRNSTRAEISLQLIRAGVADAVMVKTIAPSPLASLMDFVTTGDLASVYLAFLRGVDPSPVDAIATLKRRLADA